VKSEKDIEEHLAVLQGLSNDRPDDLAVMAAYAQIAWVLSDDVLPPEDVEKHCDNCSHNVFIEKYCDGCKEESRWEPKASDVLLPPTESTEAEPDKED